ncbi:MAG: efflux RND transporter periplasmic adaptor subunit [Gammaproteobacteria bacterium]|jgi:RND family efflux transporter MFP subunit
MARQNLIAALIFLFTAPLMAANDKNTDLPFPTHTVEKKSMPKEVLLDAVIEAVNRSTVSAETSGRVMEIKFDIGDLVQAGTVLIRITKAEQQSQFAATEAQRNEATARLQEAQDEFERVKGVFAKKLVAQSALDKAKADLKAAEQRLQAADARVKQAQAQLHYTVVKAPYTGVVVDRHVELGEMVAPGKPVMTGLSLKKLRAAAQVPQSLVTALRAADKVRVIFSQQQVGEPRDISLQSQRLQVSPQADVRSHTFLVRAYLPDSTPNVYPGMFSKMAITTGEREALLVPSQAVVHRSELTAVYVIKGQHVHLRQVRIGRHEGDSVEILAGLQAGEQVALDPIQAGIYLKEQNRKGNSEHQTNAAS